MNLPRRLLEEYQQRMIAHVDRAYELGRQRGYLEGYGARLAQETEARKQATDSILRVIQGGKK